MEEEVIQEVLVQEEAPNAFAEAVGHAADDAFFKQTSGIWNWIKAVFTWENVFKCIGGVCVVLILFLIYKLLRRGLRQIPERKFAKAKLAIAEKALKYLFYTSIALYLLSLFGIDLTAIWGAAGVAGIAIGFAAQTSVSNLISGLFVITEGSIHAGDTIIVDGVTGVVDEIKLLSVRVHTYDNQMVRIPNSTIIDKSLTNNSYFKCRRLTIGVSVDYKSDMRKCLEVLSKAPSLCPTVLKDPAPAVWFDGFGDSSINMTVAVWFKPDDFLTTKNDIFVAIKQVLDEASIEIPFNKLDVKVLKES
ncbi:MAG: mechanosensitive ion channel family protein [Treponemataceae bacterium]|nr:mechanosensitive ion channel family protein [Treponemataceae bacterium]